MPVMSAVTVLVPFRVRKLLSTVVAVPSVGMLAAVMLKVPAKVTFFVISVLKTSG